MMILGARVRTKYAGGVGGGGTNPAWASGVAVNQIVEISGTAMNIIGIDMSAPNGSGGAATKLSAWNGLVNDNLKVYAPWLGGHDDYWGNEVDLEDFAVDSPAWQRLESSSVSAAVTAVTSSGYYSDGRPASCHSYGTLQLNKTDNRIIRIGTPAPSKGGSQYAPSAAFDLTNNVSLAAGTVADLPTAPIQTPWVCFRDPATDNLYAYYSFRMRKYTRSTNIFANGTLYLGSHTDGYSASADVDTTRNRALIIGGSGGPLLYDLSADTFTEVALSGPEAASLDADAPGLRYCVDIDKFIARNAGAGGAFYTIHPTTLSVDLLTTSGGSGIGASLHEVHTKLLRVTLPNGEAGVLYVPNWTSNFHYMRTS